MHHTKLQDLLPLTCSKCGSTDAVKPINNRRIAVHCNNCGHTKLTPEAEHDDWEKKAKELGIKTNQWTLPKQDEPPTF